MNTVHYGIWGSPAHEGGEGGPGGVHQVPGACPAQAEGGQLLRVRLAAHVRRLHARPPPWVRRRCTATGRYAPGQWEPKSMPRGVEMMG